MKVTDARTLSPEAQADLRRRVVAAVSDGMTQLEAGRVFGISRRAVGVWVRAHRAGGPSALDPQRRGRAPGDPAALCRGQQAEILTDVLADCPDGFGLNTPLWSRRVLACHIERRFGLHLAPSTVGSYLNRWGLVAPSGRLGIHPNHVHVTWSRPVPRFLNSPLLPGPGALLRGPNPAEPGPPREDLDVITAYSRRGVAYFRCLPRPWSRELLTDLGRRLVRVNGPALVVVHRWPADQADLLHEWMDAPAWLLGVVLSGEAAQSIGKGWVANRAPTARATTNTPKNRSGPAGIAVAGGGV